MAREFPRWTLFIQVMTETKAKAHKHNPFDLTKVWPKSDYPLIEVGVMELNRYPGQLLRGSGAGGVLTGQCRAGHRFFARQDAPGGPVGHLGATTIDANRITDAGAFALEAIGTFFLVNTVQQVAVP